MSTAENILSAMRRVADAAATASDLMNGCPDDDVMEGASAELDEACAALTTLLPP